MRSPSRLTSLGVLAVLALAGCKARPLPGSSADVVTVPTGDPSGGGGGPTETLLVTNCTPCHGTRDFKPTAGAEAGDPLVAAAPPRDTNGNTVAGAASAVGAHRAHLVDGPLARAVECASCHLVPTGPFPHDPQRQGKVSFSRVATASVEGPRATPTWNPDPAQRTCSGTYCHGAFKNGVNGGAGATVSWDGGPVACGSCHGVSTNDGPGGNHPTGVGTSCASCHGGTYTSTAADPALHVNGLVDLGNMTCSTCHGDNTRVPVASAGALDADASPLVQASPPLDTARATVSAAVGAHLAHVNQGDARGAGPLSLAVSCVTCHPVAQSKAHANGTVNVVFTGVAVTGPVTPAAYTRAAGCASTYCHGNFPGGLGANAISWSGASKLDCNACHLSPPPVSAASHHPQNPSCATCHPGYTATTVNVAQHVDGQVQHQPAAGCTQCHGDLSAANVARTDVRAAPAGDAAAVDTHGNPATATSARGVGAHAAHLTGTTFRSTAVACAECHVVPAAGDTAHASSANATLTFGTLATTAWADGVVTPAWNGATCANTYCHGNFKNGANAAPSWAGASPVACGSCHGVSTTNGPGGNHPTGDLTNCASCHGDGYTSTQVNGTLHLNGALDVLNMSCTSCHGDGARTPVAGAGTTLDVQGRALVLASPPRDTHGVTVSPQVGAHLAHLNQGDAATPGPLSSPIACVTCHTVPTSLGHSSGTAATVTLGGLALTSNANASYAAGTCSATYCHGNFQGGNGPTDMSWSATGKLGCTSCHGAPPPVSAHHPQNTTCGSCHTGYTSGTVAVATHVDGLTQHTPAAGCTQCHGDLAVANAARTDVRVAPAGDGNAVDTHGNPATATSARGVGAHAAHLTGSTWRAAPIACGECHVVPAAGDTAHASSANATLTFGTLATTAWADGVVTPAWNGATCANTYCHGNFKNGANASPTWTAPGTVACGSCHGFAPPNGPGGTHPPIGSGKDCNACHAAAYSYVNGTVDKALHMNGVQDGGGEPSSPGSSCGGCHTAIFTAMTTATGAPASRHFLTGGDAPGDTAAAWVTTLVSVSVASGGSCVSMCHGDHPHDATSPASTTHQFNVYVDAVTSVTRGAASPRIAAGGSGTQNRDATDFRGTAASGGLCMSCHTKPVDAARPALAIATFDASAHDFTFNTVNGTRLTWQYALHSGSFDRNCTKCHASAAEGTTPTVSADGSGNVSVHFGDNAFLLAGKKTPGGTAAGFVCYNCHGNAASPAAGAQGNRSGKNIQAMMDPSLGHTYIHPANADSTHDSVDEFNRAAFGNALGRPAGAGQRHASCMDCHDVHEARAGLDPRVVGTNAAGRPLQGAWGVQLGGTLASWATPTAANFTKVTITAGTTPEAALCFKCHSAYYGTLPTSPSGGFQETDQAKEFNTNNPSFHPVLGSAANNLGATSNIIAPWTRTSLMTCTDCHESDTVSDPNGPHGSASPFMLKGNASGPTKWDSTLVGGSGGMPANTFCANCHNANFTNSRFPRHVSESRHRVACTNCHARIPHGGRRPGFLVNTVPAPVPPATGCIPAGGAYIAGWDDSAPYATPGTGSRLCVKTYPSASANWDQKSYCGCNGTGH